MLVAGAKHPVLEVAFLETDISITSSLMLFLINRFVDLGFIVDIGFTFFLPFLNAQVWGLGFKV